MKVLGNPENEILLSTGKSSSKKKFLQMNTKRCREHERVGVLLKF
jgi:hypothetical protein